MRPKNLIIFDFDGVVVGSEPAQLAAWERYFSDTFNVSIDQSKIQLTIGKKLSEQFDFILNLYNLRPSEEVRESFENRFRSFFADSMDLVSIDEKFPPFLLKVKEHSKYCIGTNAPVSKVLSILKKQPLYNLFEGKIHSAYEINRWKPEPDLFLHCCEIYGIDIKNSIVVEDSKEGLQAASKAGIEGVYLNLHDRGIPEELYSKSFTNYEDLFLYLESRVSP